MSGLDFAGGLEEGLLSGVSRPVSHLLHPVRAVAGLLGLAVVSAAGYASRHLFSSEGEMPSGSLFVPKQGVENVAVRPDGPSVLGLLRPPVPEETHAVFIYTDVVVELEKGAKRQVGWLYGAERFSSGQLAEPTGRTGDVVKGHLLEWPASEFAAKLKELDGAYVFDAANPDQGHLRRSLVRIVLEDGSSVPAYWYYQLRVPLTGRRLGKLALVGCGGVGSNVAHLAFMNDIAQQITMIDIGEGRAASLALDLNHASGVTRSSCRAEGGTEMSMLKGADVVVVTAGRARTPGMTRADLIDINSKVIGGVGEAIKQYAPKAVVIVVTNPLDEMTVEMLRSTGFPRQQVIGMAGTLDSSRFRHSLARAAGVDPADVQAITLGSHGDEMAPVPSLARIQNRPLSAFLSEETVAACVKDAVTGGGQVVALKKTGSATIAPAHAVVELIDHMRGAISGSVPASVMLDGEYGIKGVVLGVPCIMGMNGLVSVEVLPLSDLELTALKTAADAIRSRLKASGILRLLRRLF
eukprot:gb/GEZN01006142.1/.p1 GENE.gb/GEZN01006142.1/~~gb/GEZN01006142.1/.p1  ORF type:complete len:523 (+),score=93.87 gb/GEZN01006142.1/:22-1590(+)